TLLKDKGISRLPLAEGSKVKSDGKRLEIRFELNENESVTLFLSPLEDKRLAGRAAIIDGGKEVLNVDVFLVPKLKPKRKRTTACPLIKATFGASTQAAGTGSATAGAWQVAPPMPRSD